MRQTHIFLPFFVPTYHHHHHHITIIITTIVLPLLLQPFGDLRDKG